MTLLREYTDRAIASLDGGTQQPGMRRTTAEQGVLQRRLWRLAGQAIAAAPVASAARLYVDSLNSTIDSQSARLSALNNRVPGPVLALEVLGAAAALGLLALHISVLGRGLIAMIAAARPRDTPVARDVRPRPADPRADHRPLDPAGVGSRVDDAATGCACPQHAAQRRSTTMKRRRTEFLAIPVTLVWLGLLFLILWAADAGLVPFLIVGVIGATVLVALAVVAMRRPRDPAVEAGSAAFEGGAPPAEDGLHRILLVIDDAATRGVLERLPGQPEDAKPIVLVVAPAVSSRVRG